MKEVIIPRHSCVCNATATPVRNQIAYDVLKAESLLRRFEMSVVAMASTDDEQEFATINRMLIYIRDSSRVLQAQNLEYCLEMAIVAVSDELNARGQAAAEPLEVFKTTRSYQ